MAYVYSINPYLTLIQNYGHLLYIYGTKAHISQYAKYLY